MARYALVRNGKVENIAEWSGNDVYDPGAGVTIIRSDTAKIGDDYDGTTFSTPFNLGAAKMAKLMAVGGLAMQTLGAGYKPTGTKLLAGHNLQASPNDQDRLHKAATLYRRKVELLEGDKVEARFRTFANENKYLTYKDGLILIQDQMGDWLRRIEHKVWDLKDAILKALDKAALDAIDINSGWPSE